MILILDFGSQTAKLIARRVRECNVYSEVASSDISLAEIEAKNPSGIILSGGPASVYDQDAPDFSNGLLELGIPVLGICYGMQLITRRLKGDVQHSSKQEYGKVDLEVIDDSDLLAGIQKTSIVWMSHGDSVKKLPQGFVPIGSTPNTSYTAIAHHDKKIFGVQFHPEVVHTEFGKLILENFVFRICQSKPNWTMKRFVDKQIELIRKQVGKEKVLLGLSGGVDSTTVAVLLNKAIGDQLICMFIDHGFMRKDEARKIVKLFNEQYKIRLIHVDASKRFFDKIQGVSDPEKKRKIIGHEFIATFEEEAKDIMGEIKFFAQGTLYPDVIESAVGVSKNAVKIKSHHNVGGLPDRLNFKIIEPLRMLFKDEVRKVGLELGIPEKLVFRQPFPGPGLAVRIIGEVTPERVKILQESDEVVVSEIKRAGLYRDLWQAFAVLVPIKTVGVMGDKRTYQHTLAVRAVTSEDAMTANWARLPYDVLESISTRIINEVQGINRVVYDISSKPPSTIEWE